MPRREFSRLQLSARHLAMLRALLTQHVPRAEVWAYGSCVSCDAHEGSDLDLVLRNPANLFADVEGFAELQETLQQSSLPMLVETHAWARLPEPFHRNIEQEYAVIRAANSRALGCGG